MQKPKHQRNARDLGCYKDKAMVILFALHVISPRIEVFYLARANSEPIVSVENIFFPPHESAMAASNMKLTGCSMWL